jgi:hypothetical protein
MNVGSIETGTEGRFYGRAKKATPKPSPHYYTTDLSSIAQNAFSLGDFGDRN